MAHEMNSKPEWLGGETSPPVHPTWYKDPRTKDPNKSIAEDRLRTIIREEVLEALRCALPEIVGALAEHMAQGTGRD